MVRKCWFIILSLFLLGLFLSGCPKKVVKIPPVEAPPVENPIGKLLEAFSSAETLQAKASIRLDTVRKGEELKFLLFQKYSQLTRLIFSKIVQAFKNIIATGKQSKKRLNQF